MLVLPVDDEYSLLAMENMISQGRYKGELARYANPAGGTGRRSDD
jgi:hypothetical protein